MPCTFNHEWRAPDPDALDIVFAHHKLHQRIRVTMDQALEGNFVSYAQYRMLALLDHRPNMFLNELARELRVTRQATRGVLNRLDWSGLVERVEGYEREQAKPFRMTDLGRHRLARMHDAAATMFAPIDQRLEAADRRTLATLMLTADRALEPPHRAMWWLE